VELEATSEAAAAQGRQAELEDKAAEAAVTEEEEEEEVGDHEPGEPAGAAVAEEVTLEESARRDRDGDDPCDTGEQRRNSRRRLTRRRIQRRRGTCSRCESLRILAKFESVTRSGFAPEPGSCGIRHRNQVCPSGQYCNRDNRCGSSEQDMDESFIFGGGVKWSNNAGCYCSEDGGYCNQ